jgi:hypothetical protein
MEFVDIASLGTPYRYDVQIEKKMKQKRREFGSTNASQSKQGKGIPNIQKKGQIKYGQSQDNQSKTQHKKGNEKSKKDIGKWCEYNKITWHNTEECRSKKSLVDKLKAFESEEDFDYESNLEGEKWIIVVEPSTIVATTKVQISEPEEPKEGEHFSLTDVGKGRFASFHFL